MNKRQLILNEAKRLFGKYGYLGFTLKQLAQACDMTSPALYYFYASKAELFVDCLLSEFANRRTILEHCIEYSDNIVEFAGALAHEVIDVPNETTFSVGLAMREIIHLPESMQEELRNSWDAMLIAPVDHFLRRVSQTKTPFVPFRLLATYFINMATFSVANSRDFTRDELASLFVTVAQSLETPLSPPIQQS